MSWIFFLMLLREMSFFLTYLIGVEAAKGSFSDEIGCLTTGGGMVLGEMGLSSFLS
jgi:hypothetical protein